MAFKNIKKNIVLFKYNGTPISTDNVTLSSPVSLSPKIMGGDIDEVNSTFGSKRSYVIQDGQQAEFNIEISARANATDTAPEIADLLKSSLINTETIDNVLHTVTYTTNSASDHLPSTVLVYEDEEEYVIDGAVSNLNISGKIKEPLKFSFAVKGFVSSVNMTQTMPTVVNDSNDLLIIDSITGFTSNGTTVNISDFTFDMQNNIAENYNVALKEYKITDFDPKLDITALKIKNQDVWTPLALQTLENIVITIKNGATNTKSLTINIPRAISKDLKFGNQNGLQTITKTYRAENNVGDDNFSLVWADI